MNEYCEETYGERIAGIYDELYAGYDPAAITALDELARGGRALELGIGTGRIALPLRHSGVEVHGIDISQAMLDKLRAKPGGEKIPITIGNFADVAVEGQFSLIYILFNTLFALLTQEEQLCCFHNVATHLEPQGVFVVEAFVPDLRRFDHGQAVRAVEVGVNSGRLDISQLDPVMQLISSQHLVIGGDAQGMYPVKIRYVWPSEMDLMARLAGMVLQQRWGDWEGGAFTAQSGKHISIYGLSK